MNMMKKEYDSTHFPEFKVSYADVLRRALFYPENQIARDFAYLMRRKSFTKKELEYLKNMGFQISISIREVKIPDNL